MMKTPPLAQILLANHPELAGHLEAQAVEMRAPRRDSGKAKPRRQLRVAVQAGVTR